MTPALKVTRRLGGTTGSEKTNSFVGIFKMLTILKASALIEQQLSGIN
jgi:hypothetical protein